ncbi:hypothetical protein OG216_26060 [Streptomycetaceae bacterium NBC_01309]
MRLVLGEVTEVERHADGVMVTVTGPGMSLDAPLDEDAAVDHVVAILDLLEHPARERALQRARAALEESVAERMCSALPGRDAERHARNLPGGPGCHPAP